MSEQQALFEDRPLRFGQPPRPPAQRHSATSIAAAEQARTGAETQRERVWEWLSQSGPATDEQIQDALNLNPSTQRPRRVELVRAGRVRAVDNRGRTRSGRAATRWAAIPGGRGG